MKGTKRFPSPFPRLPVPSSFIRHTGATNDLTSSPESDALRILAALVLATLLLAPPATAGGEQDPDVPGVAGDYDDPTLDFQGAWLESQRDGVRFTVKFGGARGPPVDHYYAVIFTLRGERQVAVVGFDDEGNLHSDLRPPNFVRQAIRGPEQFSDNLEDVTFQPGTPAYVSATIPFSQLDSLEPGKVVIDLAGATGYYQRTRGNWVDSDGSSTDNAFVIESVLLPVVVQRNVGWFAGAAFAALSLSAVGVMVMIKKKRAPPVRAPAPEAPERLPSQAAVAKFRLDPRQK